MRKIIVLVRQAGLGQVGSADRQFSLEMLDKFFHTLEAQPVKPQAICFYTDGVKLVGEGSPIVFSLKLIQGMAIRVLSCKSCLERFGLMEKVAVGEVVGMNEIVGLMMEADSVITI